MLDYKKYDYINKDQTLIKILVSYIKPAKLFKTEVLTPIHLGREVAIENSKDGIISPSDLEWLYKNCIGDNNFEGNISHLNRQIGFLTGIYYAWKNYHELGNPQYIGSFGYRRFFEPQFLEVLQDYDFFAPKKLSVEPNIKEHFIKHHGAQIYEETIKTIKKIYPAEIDDFERYLNLASGYFYEIYVMKKEIFFDFCEWIFPIMNELLTVENDENKEKIKSTFSNNDNILDFYDKRLIGFALERISGYYLYKISKTKFFKELNVIVLNDENTKTRANIRNQKLCQILRSHIKENNNELQRMEELQIK